MSKKPIKVKMYLVTKDVPHNHEMKRKLHPKNHHATTYMGKYIGR